MNSLSDLPTLCEHLWSAVPELRPTQTIKEVGYSLEYITSGAIAYWLWCPTGDDRGYAATRMCSDDEAAALIRDRCLMHLAEESWGVMLRPLIPNPKTRVQVWICIDGDDGEEVSRHPDPTVAVVLACMALHGIEAPEEART